MIAHYAGHERFTIFFENPNHFAALVAAVLAGAYAFAVTGEHSDRLRLCVAAAAISFLSFICFISYSRGAMVALSTSVALCIGGMPKKWKSHIVLILAICFAGALVPDLLSRGRTIGNMNDPSVGNRLILWQTTLALMSELDQLPISRDEFTLLHSTLHQPERISDQLAGPVAGPINSYLSLMLYHGPLYAIAVLGLTAYAVGVVIVTGTPIYLKILCVSTFSLAVSGVFNNLLSSPFISALSTIVLAAVISLSIIFAVRGSWQILRIPIIAGFAIASISCVVLIVLLRSYETSHRITIHREEGAVGYLIRRTKPDSGSRRSAIIHVIRDAIEAKLFVRSPLRPALREVDYAIVINPGQSSSIRGMLQRLAEPATTLIAVAAGESADLLLNDCASILRADRVVLNVLNPSVGSLIRANDKLGAGTFIHALYPAGTKQLSDDDVRGLSREGYVKIYANIPIEECYSHLWQVSLMALP